LPVIEAYFKGLQAAGATLTEAFVIYTWGGGWRNQIHRIIGYDYDRDEATGQPVAAYGDYKFPHWDLESWNDAALTKWRDICALAKKYGLTLSLRLHDFCSLKDGFEKRHYPFSGGKRNLQHQQGKYDSGMWAWDSSGNPHGFDESHKIGPYYRTFLKVFIPLVQESGVDYRVVPMNEADVLGDPESGRTERCVAWTDWHLNALAAIPVDAEKILISTSRGYEAFSKLRYTMELHGVNSPQALQSVIDHFGTANIFPNGDGPDSNAQGRVGDKPGKREPSVAQAVEMARILKANGMNKYAYFHRRWDRGKRPGTDTDEDYYDAIRAMCNELAK
jgi:hypothetical protein